MKQGTGEKTTTEISRAKAKVGSEADRETNHDIMYSDLSVECHDNIVYTQHDTTHAQELETLYTRQYVVRIRLYTLKGI